MATSSVETGSALLDLSNSLAGAVENAGKSLVAVHARRHTPSTGIYWQAGVIVTADHTIEREENITVTLPNGSSIPAQLAGRDASTDLAVLKIDGGGPAEAQTGDTGDLKVGHIVLAVARPGEHGLSASWGTVSAIGGSWRTWGGGQIDQLVRPDLILYPGFSGGALVDASGKVVGVNTSGLSRNMTLTIPANTVRRVVEQLLTRGRISRGYLGVAMQGVQLPESLTSTLGLPSSKGLIVVSVEDGGPAEKAGMLVGDVLLALNETPVTDTEAVQSVLGAEQIGKPVQARILRAGQPTELTLTVGERPWKGD
ncbi:MAG: S1C family serine protease [Chloroflexota bacterium]